MFRGLANRPGEALTLRRMGRLARALGDEETAVHHYRTARELFAAMGAGPEEARTERELAGAEP